MVSPLPSDINCNVSSSLSTNKSSFTPTNDKGWSDGLPDRIYYMIFTQLSGKEQLACRLVCAHWEDQITPLISSKSCLVYRGRPQTLLLWMKSFAANFQNPSTRFTKVCLQNPSLAVAWNEFRIRDMTPKASRRILDTFLSPALNPSVNFNNVVTLSIQDCAYKFRRLHSFFTLMPKLQNFTDINTFYLIDCSACCSTFPDVQERIVRPFDGVKSPTRRLSLTRDDAGFKTIFVVKILSLTCQNLESFEMSIDTFKYPLAVALIDRMDYGSCVGLLLNANINTLKELKLYWIGHLAYLFFDDILRCLGVMIWNNTSWNLTKVDFHFDWMFPGNPEYHTILIPFIQRLEHLKELKIKHIILLPEWAEALERTKPDNYALTLPTVEFGVILTDNGNLVTGQVPTDVIAAIPYLKESIKTIRVSLTSEHTDELKTIVPISTGDVFQGTSELFVHRTDWKPLMRFISFNVDKICETFKNLTLLTILDGYKDEYRRNLRSRKQWDRMSNAHICDNELQLILKNLGQLKTLRLRCRMVYLTDSGMTGLSHAAITEMKEKKSLQDIPDPTTNWTGYSFSNLPDLRMLSLCGLGRAVTDITCSFAFEGMKFVQFIELVGDTSITKRGRIQLQAKMRPVGCEVKFC